MGNMIMFVVMFGLFIISIIFTILDKGSSEMVFDDTEDYLNTEGSAFATDVSTTVGVWQNVWKYIPFLSFIGMIYYAFVSSQGDE